MSIYAPPSNIQSVFNPSNYGGLGVDGQITTNYLDANYVQFPVVQGNMTLVGTNILGDVTQQGDLTTTGDITGETIEGTSFLVGTTNLLTEIGTKQDTIQDGDLTIAKTDGLQTALENKYDNTGGLISGGVQITGQLAPNGNIFTDERLVIQSGNTMEIQDETEVKISSGVVDIVVDGSDESINLNGYTFLNGSLELAEDESIFLNEVGGGNSKVLNYFNYNKLTDDVEGKQNTIDDGDLTIAKTDGLQTALDNKYDDTGGTINGNVDISGDLVTNGQLDCDLDAFHYSAGDETYTRGVGADVSWTETKRGSTIQNGDSFRPKYTGKYSITLAIFLTAQSSGQVRVGLKLNGSEYNLNGGGGTYLVCVSDSANSDVNTFTGNIIVDAVAGQDIKAFVITGTLRYYGSHSYLAGYYIGNT